MKTNILTQTKNPFLEREELTIKIEAESNPSIQNVIEATKKDAELVVVKRINTPFGKNTFTADILIYDSKEAKEKTETIPKKIRKKMAEEKKAAEEAEAKKIAEEQEAKKENAEKKELEETKKTEENTEQKEETKTEEKEEAKPETAEEEKKE